MWLSLEDVDALLTAIGGMRAEYGSRADEAEQGLERRLRDYRASLVREIERCGGYPR